MYVSVFAVLIKEKNVTDQNQLGHRNNQRLVVTILKIPEVKKNETGTMWLMTTSTLHLTANIAVAVVDCPNVV